MTLGEMYKRKGGKIWVLSEDGKSAYAKAKQTTKEFIEMINQEKKQKEEEKELEKNIEKSVKKAIEKAFKELMK